MQRKEGSNMFKGTPEIIEERREEIISACERLYQKMNFKDLTLKEIGNETSFSRPTIYNYFQTKEEIYLAMVEREFERWNADLEDILNNDRTYTKEQLAEVIACSLEKREQMLKMLCNNNHELEANSNEELMNSFRKGCRKTVRLFEAIVQKNFPEMSHEEIMGIIYVFFPFMVGIYPYIMITDKHRKAAEEAGADICKETIHEFTYNCLIRLLNN